MKGNFSRFPDSVTQETVWLSRQNRGFQSFLCHQLAQWFWKVDCMLASQIKYRYPQLLSNVCKLPNHLKIYGIITWVAIGASWLFVQSLQSMYVEFPAALLIAETQKDSQRGTWTPSSVWRGASWGCHNHGECADLPCLGIVSALSDEVDKCASGQIARWTSGHS